MAERDVGDDREEGAFGGALDHDVLADGQVFDHAAGQVADVEAHVDAGRQRAAAHHAQPSPAASLTPPEKIVQLGFIHCSSREFRELREWFGRLADDPFIPQRRFAKIEEQSKLQPSGCEIVDRLCLMRLV